MSEPKLILATRDPSPSDSALGSSSDKTPRVPATSPSRNNDSSRPASEAVTPTTLPAHAHAQNIDSSIPNPVLDPDETACLVSSPPDDITLSLSSTNHSEDTAFELDPEADSQSSGPSEVHPPMECANSGETGKLTGECRICQEEDVLRNLDSPCTCAGSLKYAHPSCLQHWCNEKKNTLCEICHQPYKATYTIPEPRAQDPASSVLSIEIREDRAPDGTHSRVLTLRDTVTGEETRFDLTQPEEPQDPWACCKAVLLIVFVLMLLPKALMLMVDAEQESGEVSDDPTASMMRMIALGLPLLILLRVMHAANERQRHQEELAESEAAEAAAHVAFLVHARHAQLMAMAHSEPSEGGALLPGSAESRPVAQGVV